ncbi:Phosphoenolpyruvate carboxykinase [ATP] [Olea europaea subsp. europaea]|uniref:Phosphoenolpyruvate carboxykinase [ATP] n=1 Tax=Olea europaea subsp. europaea TaxID=158383 RepID=A0A8S0RGS0_OLEEU|nr:Phosphoenolpyruvate carboxykinase [ATP] [Olea europaea subsp. europaea]
MSILEKSTIRISLLQRILVQLIPSNTFPMLKFHVLLHTLRISYSWHVMRLVCSLQVSKLSLPQTMYHFISGYTALVAGTEEGIKEPQATFSACFGAAFIMLHPTKYTAMLAAKMQKHGATGWLVNTGWSGGRYGSGSRIKLAYTRKIIDAIHSGSLLKANYKKTEVFGL